METSPQARESLIAVGSEMDYTSNQLMPTDDQFFLLHFIMGTYFAPDLKGERPRKSILQRRAEGLPPYTPDQLAGSHIKTVEVERVYYYVLRKADQSVTVKLPRLHQFFHGQLPIPLLKPAVVYPQFPDLFPPHLHPHSLFKNLYKIIDNVLFINNPEISYIKLEDIDRFKRLTGLEDLRLDRDAAKLHTYVDGGVLYNVAVRGGEHGSEILPPMYSRAPREPAELNDFYKTKNVLQNVHAVRPLGTVPYSVAQPQSNAICTETLPVSSVPHNSTPLTNSFMASLPPEIDTDSVEKSGPSMIFLPSRPTEEELSNIVAATKGGCALTGSAAVGQIGPVLGLLDIGECEDAYLFRVSLPGVKRNEREFSCEVENDGKVLIRGVTTTGEKTVHRYAQVFEMQSQNLCPPGRFSISFKLPGPVDPQQFSGNFGTDGILEGIVMKRRQKKTKCG